ncbi:MAG TPA: DUF1134 domain-containing protein [Candidatus Methylomirabilis sp.]|nr:DUF1134 domain-containing protein [Candidatus Methylomirabilis sp.]
MRRLLMALVVGGLVSVVRLAGAQGSASLGTLELSQASVAAGIGFSWGSGTLTYQGRKYPVKVLGLSVGEVGITRATAKGVVFDLRKIEDFPGNYVAGGAGGTLGGGGEGIVMKNQNGVVMELTSTTVGASLKVAVSGIQFTIASPSGT